MLQHFIFCYMFKLSTLNDTEIKVMVHDPQEQIHDAKHDEFVLDIRPKIGQKISFSKTCVHAIPRQSKMCTNEPLGSETCVVQKVKFLKKAAVLSMVDK